MQTTNEVSSTKAALPGFQNLNANPEARSNRFIFRAAEKSAEFADHLRAHYRETRRTSVEIPCDLKLIMADGTVFDTGSGMIRNVSPSGALVSSIKLIKNSYPAGVFKLVLSLNSSEYEGICIEASPVRMVIDCGGLGVKFDEIFVTV